MYTVNCKCRNHHLTIADECITYWVLITRSRGSCGLRFRPPHRPLGLLDVAFHRYTSYHRSALQAFINCTVLRCSDAKFEFCFIRFCFCLFHCIFTCAVFHALSLYPGWVRVQQLFAAIFSFQPGFWCHALTNSKYEVLSFMLLKDVSCLSGACQLTPPTQVDFGQTPPFSLLVAAVVGWLQ